MNKTLSIDKIILCWLLQEYTKENFFMTGGKTFIFINDYRNIFITNVFKITKNFFIYLHLIIFLELGIFFFIFFIFYYLVLRKFENRFDFNFVNKIVLINSFLFIYIYLFFKKFSGFDIFLVFKPILFIFFLIFNILPFFIFNYLLYKMISKKITKKLAFLYKFYIEKSIFNFIYIFIFSVFILSTQNLTTENFFKEILFTFLILFFNFSNYY